MEYKKQVDGSHYSFEKYFFPGRWMSYWHQTKEIVNREDIQTVLDIGPGTDFLKQILQIHRPDISYESMDVAEDVKPDYVGSVTDISMTERSYDAVCAFQVLEHITFEDFEKALSELKRVSKRYVFISLPHFGPSVEFWLKLPFISRTKIAFKIPYHPVHVFNGQHHWEIGKKGYPTAKIRSILKTHFTILDEYIPFENQYHHFFILKK